MKVCCTCGSFNASTQIVTPKIMLPDLKHTGIYTLSSTFYNLSVVDNMMNNVYVIAGILSVANENITDLADYRTDKVDLKTFTNFNLASVANPLATTVNLAGVTAADQIHFLCLYDNAFDINGTGKSKLSTIQSKILANVPSGNYSAMIDPTKGEGGTLGVTGCQF